jgi:hypothetical protein
MKTILFLIYLGNILIGTAQAGEADVIAVEVKKQEDQLYAFDVTVSHNDEGWGHYANSWEVVGSDGVVYGTRTLLHPHVDEQPFTRSKSGIKIPTEVKIITVRAHDSVHEYGGAVFTIAVP